LIALGASPARIGHHLLAAGDSAAAVPYILRAAETEAAVGAYRDALALVDSIRRVAGDGDGPRALALRADLLAALGDAAAATAYREAIEVAPPERRKLLQARLARMVVYGGDLDTARALLADLDLDGGVADPTILLARGNLAYFSGDIELARETSDQARRLVANSDTDWQVLDLVGLGDSSRTTAGSGISSSTELRNTRTTGARHCDLRLAPVCGGVPALRADALRGGDRASERAAGNGDPGGRDAGGRLRDRADR
jgi:tetratricopeptide (TPR) repeat protein